MNRERERFLERQERKEAERELIQCQIDAFDGDTSDQWETFGGGGYSIRNQGSMWSIVWGSPPEPPVMSRAARRKLQREFNTKRHKVSAVLQDLISIDAESVSAKGYWGE